MKAGRLNARLCCFAAVLLCCGLTAEPQNLRTAELQSPLSARLEAVVMKMAQALGVMEVSFQLTKSVQVGAVEFKEQDGMPVLSVSSGTMAAVSNDELAFLVGHEMAHQAKGHEMVDGRYLPEAEQDADAAALAAMKRAGYKPRAALALLERLRAINADMPSGSGGVLWLQAHPLDDARLQTLKEAFPTRHLILNLKVKGTKAKEVAEWLPAFVTHRLSEEGWEVVSDDKTGKAVRLDLNAQVKLSKKSSEFGVCDDCWDIYSACDLSAQVEFSGSVTDPKSGRRALNLRSRPQGCQKGLGFVLPKVTPETLKSPALLTTRVRSSAVGRAVEDALTQLLQQLDSATPVKTASRTHGRSARK